MGEQASSTHSYEAYLALEAESEIKHEYHDGFIVAMAGGTGRHSRLCSNLSWVITSELVGQGKRCMVYNSDIKVRIEAVNRTYYPDVISHCEDPIYSEKDGNALTNPLLIVEVLSDKTESFDRGTKFHHYRQLSSFREYVLVSQKEYEVTVHFHREQDLWEIKTYRGMDDLIPLQSLGCQVRLGDIYRLEELS